MVRRSRYIAILTPILALISMIPDIGVQNTPISGRAFFSTPTSGYPVLVPDIGPGDPISGHSIIRYRVTLLSDIGCDVGYKSDISTDNFSFRQVLLPGTNTMIAMILTAIAVGIARWTQVRFISCLISYHLRTPRLTIL
jgi:hypothetical protein